MRREWEVWLPAERVEGRLTFWLIRERLRGRLPAEAEIAIRRANPNSNPSTPAAG